MSDVTETWIAWSDKFEAAPATLGGAMRVDEIHSEDEAKRLWKTILASPDLESSTTLPGWSSFYELAPQQRTSFLKAAADKLIEVRRVKFSQEEAAVADAFVMYWQAPAFHAAVIESDQGDGATILPLNANNNLLGARISASYETLTALDQLQGRVFQKRDDGMWQEVEVFDDRGGTDVAIKHVGGIVTNTSVPRDVLYRAAELRAVLSKALLDLESEL